MMMRSGKCLCGAISFEISNPPETFNLCHCSMCRRWTGGRFYSYVVPRDSLTIFGQDAIVERQTSEWAARANCKICGSPIWYRPLGTDRVSLPVGLLDDQSGLRLKYEYYSDLKGQALDPTEDTVSLDTAETIAMFAPSEEGEPQ